MNPNLLNTDDNLSSHLFRFSSLSSPPNLDEAQTPKFTLSNSFSPTLSSHRKSTPISSELPPRSNRKDQQTNEPAEIFLKSIKKDDMPDEPLPLFPRSTKSNKKDPGLHDPTNNDPSQTGSLYYLNEHKRGKLSNSTFYRKDHVSPTVQDSEIVIPDDSKLEISHNFQIIKPLTRKITFQTSDSKDKYPTMFVPFIPKPNPGKFPKPDDPKPNPPLNPKKLYYSHSHNYTSDRNTLLNNKQLMTQTLKLNNLESVSQYPITSNDLFEDGRFSGHLIISSFTPSLPSVALKQNLNRDSFHINPANSFKHSIFNRQHRLTTDSNLLNNREAVKNFNVDRFSVYESLNRSPQAFSLPLTDQLSTDFNVFKSHEYRLRHKACKEILEKFYKRSVPSSVGFGFSSPSSTEREYHSVMMPSPSSKVNDSKIGKNSKEEDNPSSPVNGKESLFHLQIYPVEEASVIDSHPKSTQNCVKTPHHLSLLRNPDLLLKGLSSDKNMSKEDQLSNEKDFEKNFVNIFDNNNFEMKITGLGQSISYFSAEDDFQIKSARHFKTEHFNHMSPNFSEKKDTYTELLLLLDFLASEIAVFSPSQVQLVKKMFYLENESLAAILEVYHLTSSLIRKRRRHQREFGTLAWFRPNQRPFFCFRQFRLPLFY